MIIVEGCDGSGKSSLISSLTTHFFPELKLGPKASTSLGGVSHHREPEALSQWTDAEMARWPEEGYGPRIYDRYPLISEPIYGTIIRDRLSPAFTSQWYGSRIRTIRKLALVVFVDPGWDAVSASLKASKQMPGVVKQGHRIWLAYRTLRLTWAGKGVTYDRNDPRSILTVVSMIDNHVKGWKF